MLKTIDIQVRKMLSRERFYAEHILTGTPVILKNGMNDWPAIERWSLEYFKQTIGAVKIAYRNSMSGLHPDLTKLDAAKITKKDIFKEATLSEFIDLLTTGQDKVFLCGSGLYIYSDHCPNPIMKPVFQDFKLPAICGVKHPKSAGVWISPQNIISWLHYDQNGCHNLNAQIKGEKKVLLFPPQHLQNYYLYLYCNTEMPNFSQVNVHKPDYEKYPYFKQADCYQAYLQPGDMLYIPAYWLHSFEHIAKVNINLNFWWDETIILSNMLLYRKVFFDVLRRSFADSNTPVSKLLANQSKPIQLLIKTIEQTFLNPNG